MKKKQVILAPMAGVTDYPFRLMVRRFGNELMYGEMMASEALVRNHKETLRLASFTEEEKPVVGQLVGYKPFSMGESARILIDRGFKHIDINMGCPVRKIVGNSSGAALMKDVNLARDIIKAVVKASGGDAFVSIKMRLGWDSYSMNAFELAKIAEGEGAGAIAVHGRTRAQMYSGTADWDFIRRIKEAAIIPVIGNGDIRDEEGAKEKLNASGVDGVMVGRAMMGRPWLLSQISHYLGTGEKKPAPEGKELKDIILEHAEQIFSYYGEKRGIFIARKHICWYGLGMKGAREFRSSINASQSATEMEKFIESLV